MELRSPFREHVREMVTSLLRERGDSLPLADSDSLVLSGRFDSLAVMEVAAFLERMLGMDFGRDSFDQTDFDSVDSILGVIARAGGR